MLLRVFVLLTLLLATALPAQAEIRSLSTKVGVGDLRMACSSAGGTFSVHPDGGGYGCEKKNCDGKGGDCIIACDNNNNCNGQTPSRTITPTTLVGILQNGNPVVRDPIVTGGTSSLSSPGDASTAAAAPTPPAPIFLF